MDLFKIFGELGLKGVDKVNAQLDDVTDKGQQTQGKLSKVFGKIGKGFLTVGTVAATGLVAGATALGGLTAKAVSLAGELEQNMGGSEAVFKEHAKKMQETASKAFSNMGLSTSDYLATANKMGALFQGAGFEIEESMTLSQDCMQRAADVASIMGIDTSAAMEAIAGAAKGNFTMMDNLGVAMNDTAIEAYALEKGINKSTAKMTQQEKIGLAMEMFLEKTAYAAGNYTKENETLAGSLSTAKAALSNFLSGAGNVDDVVSSFTNAGKVITQNIIELFPKLVTGLTEIVGSLVPMIPTLLEQLLPALLTGATSLVNGLVAALPGIVSALMAALPMLIDGIVQITNGIIEALPMVMQSIVSALPTLIPALITGIISMVVTLCEQLPAIVQPIVDYLPEIIISIVNALMDNLPALIDGIISLVLGIVEALPTIIQGLVDAIPTVISRLIEGLLGALPQIIAGLIKVVFGIVKALPQIFQSLHQGVINTFKGIWDGITKVFSKVGSWFGEKFTDAKDSIVKAFSNVKEKLTAPFEKARDAIKKVVDKIKGFFSGLKFKWPKLKMPKFSVKPEGWKIGDLLKGKIPKLGITWAAEGGIFDEPTLFNTPTGMLGVGEAGAEAVAPIDKLMGYVHQAVQAETNGLSDRLDDLTDMLGAFFPQILAATNKQVVLDSGALVGQIAPKMNARLGEIQKANARGR